MEPAQVLLVDDDVEHAETMVDALRRPGHICTMVHSAAEAVDELRHGAFDVVVTDLVMESETAGLDVLRLAQEHQPDATTIMVPRMAKLRPRKQHCKAGRTTSSKSPSIWMCSKPRSASRRNFSCDSKTRAQRRSRCGGSFSRHCRSVPRHARSHRVDSACRRFKPSGLITGESGTGKELVAAAIHVMSPRASQRYVTFNAAGQSESLLEDELFGHVRGAYTGAERDREGVFEYADKGTLFLDEIGDMPMGMQSRLLRVLESGEIVRLGANDPRETDVRFVGDQSRLEAGHPGRQFPRGPLLQNSGH